MTIFKIETLSDGVSRRIYSDIGQFTISREILSKNGDKIFMRDGISIKDVLLEELYNYPTFDADICIKIITNNSNNKK